MSVTAVLALAALGAAPAQEPPSDISRFDALLVEIDSLRSDLEWLDRRERGLVNEMDRLEASVSLKGRELQKLRLEKEMIESDLLETQTRLDHQSGVVSREEARLSTQLREFYKLGKLKELRLLLSVESPEELLPAVTYLNVLAKRQNLRLASVRQGRDEMHALGRTLQAQTVSLDSVILTEQQRLDELEALRRQSRELLEATSQQKDAHMRAIEELRRAARELESAIVSGHQEETAVPAIDISRLKGALEWPVTGAVTVPFGDVRHPKFDTVTPHPGLDIRTAPGEPIRAVMGGRVVFSRRFSGYGNTVLLDHGGNYLSVYARAAVLHVREGEEVLPGQVLGTSSERAFDGGPPVVYFEFRRDGRAVDPADWLKQKPGRRKDDRQ